MTKIIAATTRNEALVKRAIDNLQSCIDTLHENPGIIQNGGVVIIFCGEKFEGTNIESWVKTYHSIESALKLDGALSRAVYQFIREGEE